jgi:hypothetical protein
MFKRYTFSKINDIGQVEEGKERSQDEECIICYDSYKEGEVLAEVPLCGHKFHPTCIYKVSIHALFMESVENPPFPSTFPTQESTPPTVSTSKASDHKGAIRKAQSNTWNTQTTLDVEGNGIMRRVKTHI